MVYGQSYGEVCLPRGEVKGPSARGGGIRCHCGLRSALRNRPVCFADGFRLDFVPRARGVGAADVVGGVGDCVCVGDVGPCSSVDLITCTPSMSVVSVDGVGRSW